MQLDKLTDIECRCVLSKSSTDKLSMADELDDQLEYTFDASASEGEPIDGAELLLSCSETDEPILSNQQAAKTSGRREEAKGVVNHVSGKTSVDKSQPKDQTKSRKRRHEEMLLAAETKKCLGNVEPALVADYLCSLTHSRSKKGRSTEKGSDEYFISQASIKDTSTFDNPRTLESMPEFLNQYALLKSQGEELVVILCISALRVCDICRTIKRYTNESALKLINKNKLDFDKRALKSNCSIAVSTPGRILKLLSQNILDFRRLKRLVLEVSFLDVKTNSVLDLDETLPLLTKLTRQNSTELFFF